MGLDMYAFSVNPSNIEEYSDTDFKTAEGCEAKQIFYWRKFNALHRWMKDLYYAKGGTDKDFNCNAVVLTEQDLDALMEQSEKGLLKPLEGFFFGEQEVYPEDLETVSMFVAVSKTEMHFGRVVYYTSWW